MNTYSSFGNGWSGLKKSNALVTPREPNSKTKRQKGKKQFPGRSNHQKKQKNRRN